MGTSGAADHSGQENGQGPPSTSDRQRPPEPKPLGPRSPSPAPSPWPTPTMPLRCHRIQSASLLSANLKIRSAPEWPFPRGLASEHWGFATPEPLRQTHSTTTPPPGHIGAPPIIQGGRTGRALRARSNIRKSRAINPLGPCSPSPEPSPQPAPPLAAHPLARACRPPGC